MVDYVLPDFSTIKKGFCKVIFKKILFCINMKLIYNVLVSGV